ncbi:MAG: methionine-S-sulfoxide reductase [Chthoniobacteraceae bacterium]|nr:methionine-S-sulfoxide reductase [Chthoniobacteraceae bacterium]
MKFSIISLLLSAALSIGAIGAEKKLMKTDEPKQSGAGLQRITFGGGCFWCLEAVFQRLDGVKTVASGYAGGAVPNPTYKQVCTGETGHAEVVQIEFEPAKISFEKLLEVFWAAHDPTTLNRQGGDTGTQYRSVIFYEDDSQKAAAEKSKAAAQPEFKNPIVTEITPLKTFYKAEDYHQNYFNENAGTNPYCTVVIRPKLQKLLQKGLIKEPAR